LRSLLTNCWFKRTSSRDGLPVPSVQLMTSTALKLHRQALFTAAAALCLIVAGGLVTSRDAGLAVPDWPLAFGQLNPPRWWQIENVRTEHGHRILAFLVACLTAMLAWRIRCDESRKLVRRLGFTAAGLVLLQALLGGLRVLHLSIDLAMVHGWLGQMFFAVLVAIAVTTSRAWQEEPHAAQPESVRRVSIAVVLTVILQLVIGIFLRHLGESARPLLQNPVFYFHVIVAVTVTTMICWLSAKAARDGGPASRTAAAALGIVVVQFALGIGAWLVTEHMAYDRQASFLESWIPTAHVAAGASLLAASLATALLANRDKMGLR
jgi:cytochrome c oxidase assembly protein subunit 15